MVDQHLIIPPQDIDRAIHLIRGKKVILDADLGRIYCVKTKELNRAVKRNLQRFPEDFMFQLTRQEFQNLRCHFDTSSWDHLETNSSPIAIDPGFISSRHGGRRYLPYAFTEHGAIMAAAVLNSELAVAMSLYVIRAFVHLRDTLTRRKEISQKLAELELKIEGHDQSIQTLFEAIRQLMAPPGRPRRRIGFHPQDS